jgi:hypothetical protein
MVGISEDAERGTNGLRVVRASPFAGGANALFYCSWTGALPEVFTRAIAAMQSCLLA